MLQLFRVTRNIFLPQDPSGGIHSEGRWHPKGFPILYFCSSLPMCILELRANSVSFETLRSHYHFVQCEVDSGLSIQAIPTSFYKSDWTHQISITQEYGEKWLLSKRSLLLAVKCAPLLTETNFIMNPSHPDFQKIKFPTPEKIPLDKRLKD